jgi:N-methylhydantoinase A
VAARLGPGEDGDREVGLDMRYAGQEHFLTVTPPSQDGRITADAVELREAFTRDYDRTFGHTMDGAVEIVSVRATIRTGLPRRSQEQHAAAGDGAGSGSVEAYSFTRGERLPFAVVDRAALAPGSTMSGPAILLEDTATTYLDAGWTATAHPSGALFMTEEAH